ncbi:hypothetical protein TNCV_1178011 [Trichonephila clavipes]|nr:hypothetical protein TNCV_1178011 [Trichonephila clavipes]
MSVVIFPQDHIDNLILSMPRRYRVTAEIRERFQQLQNLAEKYAFLRPEVILRTDELNLDQAPQDINKEFQLVARTSTSFRSCNRPRLISVAFTDTNIQSGPALAVSPPRAKK